MGRSTSFERFVLASPHSAGLHQGHGSCLAHSPSYGDQVVSLPRRLAPSCLVPSGGSAGEGYCSVSMLPTWDCHQSPEVGSRPMSDSHLLGHGDRQPLFEGFPLSREGRNPVDSDRRISILQRAKRCLLAQPLGMPVVPLSSGSVRSPSHALSPTTSAPSVGFRGQVCRPSVVSGDIVQPRLVVRRQSYPLRCVSLAPPTGRPLLILHLGSGLGGEPPWPVRFGPVISGGGPPLHQSQGVTGDSPVVVPLRSFIGRSHSGGLSGQHHSFGVFVTSGGMFSSALNREAQLLLRRAESFQIRLVPQFIMGSRNVVAGSLSRRDQTIGSEWTLVQEVVLALQRRWPVTVDLFATVLNYHLLVYFSPLNDSMAAGTDAFLQSWDHLQAYAFPPFPLIRQVLSKLQSSWGTLLTLIASLWPQKEWYPDLLCLSVAPPIVLPSRPDLLRQPHVHCLHQNLPKLQLHAWRLSSILSDI